MKRCCIVIVFNFEVYYQFVLKSQNCKERMCNFYLRKARCLKFNGACAASVEVHVNFVKYFSIIKRHKIKIKLCV